MSTACEIDLARGGPTVVRAQLTAPSDVDVQRADLLVGHR
jgi:hypothetical protein